MPELEVVTVNTDDLVPYVNNAKLHTAEQVDQIAASIEEFGNCDPIAVWHNAEGEMEIVEGHGRLLALKKLGIEKTPVITLDHLSDEQRRAYGLVHNKLTMNSGFEEGLLSAELQNILDIDMSQFDFDVELDDMYLMGDNVAIVEDEMPEEVPTRAQPGDVWQLGKHRLMCGSATSEEDVNRLLGDNKADLLLTDPPYGVSYVGKTEDEMTIENDSMRDKEFHSFLLDAFNCAVKAMKSGASYYIFHADSRGHVFRSAVIDSGLEIRECLVWVKNSLVLGRQDYHWRHEPCLYGWKGGAAHRWYSDRKQSTVLEFDRPTASREHPTMKPVALFAYLIRNSTADGDLVLDTFGGSGTSLIAAEQTNRTCATMEIDPHYCDVIISRWERLTGQEAVKVS